MIAVRRSRSRWWRWFRRYTSARYPVICEDPDQLGYWVEWR